MEGTPSQVRTGGTPSQVCILVFFCYANIGMSLANSEQLERLGVCEFYGFLSEVTTVILYLNICILNFPPTASIYLKNYLQRNTLFQIFTVRIQRMKEGNISTLSTIAGGYPCPTRWSGTLVQLIGDTPTQPDGVPSSSVMGVSSWMGVPPSSLMGRGYPHPADGGCPYQVRMKYPPGQDCMELLPGQNWMGYSPPPEGTVEEYLIHGRQYASCVHAGELSCCFVFLEISHYQNPYP